MRRVQFDLVNGAYPDDRSHFKNTKLHKSIDKWIGQYSGEDTNIEDYTGPWPVDARYETSMSRTDFKGLFTATEYRAISVKSAELTTEGDNVFQFWDMAQTAESISVKDPRTIAGMAYLVSVNCLTQPSHDVIMLGKPA